MSKSRQKMFATPFFSQWGVLQASGIVNGDACHVDITCASYPEGANSEYSHIRLDRRDNIARLAALLNQMLQHMDAMDVLEELSADVVTEEESQDPQPDNAGAAGPSKPPRVKPPHQCKDRDEAKNFAQILYGHGYDKEAFRYMEAWEKEEYARALQERQPREPKIG